MTSLAPFDIDVTPESPELLERAKTELRETPEVREAALKELRQLLKDNDDIYFGDDEKILIIFLRACHFYPESALAMVSSIFVWRITLISPGPLTNAKFDLTSLWIVNLTLLGASRANLAAKPRGKIRNFGAKNFFRLKIARK